jgi:hypothetical protein
MVKFLDSVIIDKSISISGPNQLVLCTTHLTLYGKLWGLPVCILLDLRWWGVGCS